MSDLNLLPSEAKFQAERMHLKKIIGNVMWVLGGGWLIVVVIILAVNLLVQLDLNQLKKKHQKSVDQYKGLADEMLLNQKIKYQAKVVAVVLKERFEYGSSMEKVKSIFSDKVVIDNVEIDGAKKYKITALVNDGKNFDEVELKLDEINQGGVEGFKSADLYSLMIDDNKNWKFVMGVALL